MHGGTVALLNFWNEFRKRGGSRRCQGGHRIDDQDACCGHHQKGDRAIDKGVRDDGGAGHHIYKRDSGMARNLNGPIKSF